jgi:hypothetical protein
MAATKKAGGGHRTLFPLKVKFVDPADIGADSEFCCTAEDNCNYRIKDKVSGQAHETTPHSEWFCTRLASMIGIACPPFNVLEMPDGTLVFGSRWEGGLLRRKPGDEAGYWYEKVRSGEIPLADVSDVLTNIYAFDHFVNNVDRTLENFLVREQRNGFAILAFDFSRAWIRFGMPLPRTPLGDCHTVGAQRDLRGYWKAAYIKPDTASILLDKISKITVKDINNIINEHPSDWLTAAQKKAILKWWGSKGMLDRIREISEGIADGSCL